MGLVPGKLYRYIGESWLTIIDATNDNEVEVGTLLPNHVFVLLEIRPYLDGANGLYIVTSGKENNPDDLAWIVLCTKECIGQTLLWTSPGRDFIPIP